MIYYLFFTLITLIAISVTKYRKFGTLLLILLLTLFAGSRLDIDNDYFMYYNYFKYPFTFEEFRNLKVSMEPSIYLIPNLGTLIFSDKIEVIHFSFMVFAFLGVFIKLIAIKRYSENFALSIILYCSYLFLMQEMTTIRAGVAAAILLISIPDLVNRNFKMYLLKISFAFLFHSSSILFILAGIIVYFKIKIKYFYLALFFSFMVVIFELNILKILFLDKIFPRVSLYLEILNWSEEEKLNIFNFKILFSLLMIVLFAIFYKKLESNKWFYVMFRIHIFSLVLFFSLSTTAMVFSARSFDLISVVQILLFPMIINVFSPKFKIVGFALLTIFSIIQVYYLIDITEIYKPYESWLF